MVSYAKHTAGELVHSIIRANIRVCDAAGKGVNCIELQSADTGNWANVTATLHSSSTVDVDSIPGVTHSNIRYSLADSSLAHKRCMVEVQA